MTPAVVEDTHAEKSPSGADTWFTCPGSIKRAKGVKDKGGKYADEGTAAHWASEQILLGRATDKTVVGTKAPNGFTITADMVAPIMRYVTQVQDLVASTGGTLYIEQKLPIGQWTGEVGAKGTSDAVIVCEDELIVVDLKFGMGVEVSAERNKQLMLYALGALDKFGKADDVEDLL